MTPPTELQKVGHLLEYVRKMEQRGFEITINGLAVSIRLNTYNRDVKPREGFLFQQNCATVDEALGAMRMYEHLVSVGLVPATWPATP